MESSQFLKSSEILSDLNDRENQQNPGARCPVWGDVDHDEGEPAIADVLTSTACNLIKRLWESFSRLIAGNPKTL